ncbi:MAG: type II toxin-antitoxin system RelE family toxin [Bacilli bacterium]
MSYQIILSSSAERDLKKMDRHFQSESIRALADISDNPYQAGERLTGKLGDY